MELNQFKAGNRIQLHPGTDRWMRGDRYGEVLKVGRVKRTVRMDRSGQTIRVAPRNVAEVLP